MKKDEKSRTFEDLEREEASPEFAEKTEEIYERLMADEGFTEEQAWELAMVRAGKEGGDLDNEGGESEVFVHQGERQALIEEPNQIGDVSEEEEE